MNRIYLSPPDIGSIELEYVKEAFDSNWIAPVGPHIDALEVEFGEYLGYPHCVALSSGTAALHLALTLAGVGIGDEVVCSSLTFVASANPILYLGAVPIFIDSELGSWNMDPKLLEDLIIDKTKSGNKPKAVIVVDLYGQCADYRRISQICQNYEIALIEDAAEALGAECHGKPAGTLGDFGIFSFNGNKIITTSGGGLLVCPNDAQAKKAKFLATQSRDPAMHYQHSKMGFNYRMSNVVAGIGRGQLKSLNDKVLKRRQNFDFYSNALMHFPVNMMPETQWGRCTHWLSCLTMDESIKLTPHEICSEMDKLNIECRPLWKPLHLQPLFAQAEFYGGQVAENLYERGLCLPSGSSMGQKELKRVVTALTTLLQS